MMRSWAYNGFGVLMGTSWRASCPRWPSLRIDSLPMITLFPSQGDFCATAFHLTDGNIGTVLLVVTLDGGFIGVTAIDRDRLREPVPANRLFQKPQGSLGVPLLRKEKVNRLTVFIHGPIQIPPLALHLDVRLVHPPTDPHRTLALMECL